jgi:hypothetical protein
MNTSILPESRNESDTEREGVVTDTHHYNRLEYETRKDLFNEISIHVKIGFRLSGHFYESKEP